MSDRIYLANNCFPAYQLDWSYSLFWHSRPPDLPWFESLRSLCEADHIRLLEHELTSPTVSQFLVSTRPDIPPQLIAKRVKGRLQHLIRSDVPNAFRRNYSLRSIGSTRRVKLEQYLASQLDHHQMADPRVQEQLKKYQIHHAHVNLAEPQRTSHAIYWYNLHLVFVNEGRWREIDDTYLQNLHETIEITSGQKGHRLSRAAIIPDHLHLTLGCKLNEPPEDVAFSYMNALANTSGGRPIFKFSYYAGTFSEYDLGAIS